jgi:hypothetical protein
MRMNHHFSTVIIPLHPDSLFPDLRTVILSLKDSFALWTSASVDRQALDFIDLALFNDPHFFTSYSAKESVSQNKLDI